MRLDLRQKGQVAVQRGKGDVKEDHIGSDTDDGSDITDRAVRQKVSPYCPVNEAACI